MADLLSKHYADGRLDEAEFHERIDRAMGAKTRGDLRGLLADLPSLGLAHVSPPAPPRRRRVLRTLVVMLALMVALAVTGWSFYAPRLHVSWIVVALVVFLVLRCRHPWQRHGDQPDGARHSGQ